MQHIIFDLDGTLIDSRKEILSTYKQVFDEIAPPFYPDLDGLNMAMNINDLLGQFYNHDSDIIKKAKKKFASIYDTSGYENTSLFDGVFDILNYLKNKGHILYIATNKRHFPTERILNKKNILQLFNIVEGFEKTAGVRLTKVEMVAKIKKEGGFESGFMVGDSVGDIKAGKEENLKTVAATYGYENENDLRDSKPDYFIENFAKLVTFVD